MPQRCVTYWTRICSPPVMSTSVRRPSISSVAQIPVSAGRPASALRWPTTLATAADSPSSLTFDRTFPTVVSVQHIHILPCWHILTAGLLLSQDSQTTFTNSWIYEFIMMMCSKTGWIIGGLPWNLISHPWCSSLCCFVCVIVPNIPAHCWCSQLSFRTSTYGDFGSTIVKSESIS